MSETMLKVAMADEGGSPVEPVWIRITEKMPAFEDLDALGIYFDEQAMALEQALINSLPGGVYDRLLGRMLTRKATHFRVIRKAATA